VYTCTSEPCGDCGLTIAEDPFGGGRIYPFSQGREHNGDLLRGGFQTIQGRVPPASERGVASRTSKRLDLLSTPMLAVPDTRLEVSVCDTKGRALLLRTGKALAGDPLGGFPSAFHLRPGTHRRGH